MADTIAKFDQLLVYRNLLQDKLIKELFTANENNPPRQPFALAGELIQFAEETGLGGNLPVSYLLYQIGQGQNVFSKLAEKEGSQVGKAMCRAVAHDVAILKEILQADIRYGAADCFIRDYQPTHPANTDSFATLKDYFFDITENYSPGKVAELLCLHYARYGYGEMASCTAFKWDWDQGLVGVKHCDPVVLQDIVGYERQKQVLIENTQAFIAGRPANNVLLVGARGTGKSTSVKALANQYYSQGLRLVEVSKKDLECLPAIMNALRQWGKKFIVFLDDLSFEEFELGYKNLKSVMEGGMEAKPDNVLIYATSNRRHLVREVWNDRAGDELHNQDTINEKISLSDRFGITLTYASPNQAEYLNIVEDIAKKSNIALTPSELRAQALRWEMAHSGRSGRLARQFIANLAGKASD